MADKDKDIVSLNKELMNFDVEQVSAEELERRLELAIGGLPTDLEGTCTSFSGSCGNFTGSCGTF